MTATYLSPMSFGPAQTGESLLMEAIDEGPAFGRSGYRSTRWHLIRSAVDRIHEWSGEDVIIRHYQFYCGQMASSRKGVMVRDDVPEGEPTCGTCYGRREGVDPDRPELLFTPYLVTTPPRLCPGSRSMWFVENGRLGDCMVCGLAVRLRASGGWYNSNWGMQNHAPGPALIEGCKFHGWKELVVANGHDGKKVVACRCLTVEVKQ